MKRLSEKEIVAFQAKILDWYEKNKRDLPWRQTRDPYRILVSEIMLQQTQVNRVMPKYDAWLKVFPDVQTLAKATTAEVLRYWSGLGYNRRALYLQKAAKALNGSWDSIATLQNDSVGMLVALKKLPGIGEYTAAAVACFAFDQQVAVIDTNVRKVILTQLNHCHCEKSKTTKSKMPGGVQSHKRDCRVATLLVMTDKQLQEIADQLLPQGKAYEWNQALMDYASVMLKKEKIPVIKQSTFKDSDRYYRGQIIKMLLKQQSIRESALLTVFSIEKERLVTIVQGMEKDGLVKKEKNMITLH